MLQVFPKEVKPRG